MRRGGHSQLCAQSQAGSLSLQSGCPVCSTPSHLGMIHCVTFRGVLLPLLLGSIPTPLQICSVYGELITWKTQPNPVLPLLSDTPVPSPYTQTSCMSLRCSDLDPAMSQTTSLIKPMKRQSSDPVTVPADQCSSQHAPFSSSVAQLFALLFHSTCFFID